MEIKTRKQILEEILQRFCRVKILNYEVLYDLLQQLQTVTTTKGDEESSLLMLVQLSKKELKKARSIRDEKERSKVLRRVLYDLTNDLTNHIRIYFQSPPNSDQAQSLRI